MVIFLAAGFSTSSDSLLRRLESSLKLKATTFKAGSGIGNVVIKISPKKLLKLKIKHRLNQNILVNQHLLPDKINMEILDNIFGLDNISL